MRNAAMGPEDEQVVWQGDYLTLAVERWPGVGTYELVRKHDAAAVVPITPSGDVVLVKQFRPPVRGELTEIPAGLLDVEGEDALTCATRELFEETGYRHRTIEFMAGVYLSPGFTAEYVHLFWASIEEAPEAMPERGIEVVRMPFGRMVAAARGGKVRNAMTALGLLLAASRFGSSDDRL